jgi:hypothetical protein
MSTKNSFLAIGLTVLGTFGLSAVNQAGPQEAAPPGPKPSASPSTAPADSNTVLLLTNGQIVRGKVSHDDTTYTVSMSVGTMRFPANRVEREFQSIREVYEYKLLQLPERDVDERMKLADWCLLQSMRAEAKAQLNAILELSASHSLAKAKLAKMEAEEARLARQHVDPAVQQTSGSSADPAAAAPSSLDPAVLRSLRREMGLSNSPVIFDLPQVVAIQRAKDFARFVHPILQAHCAKCHNESYDGSFQLIQTRSRREWTEDVFLFNLDATLRLIDPDDLPKSELMSSMLRPHGNGPRPRPIFQGSNAPEYRVIAAWVNRLRPPEAAADRPSRASVLNPAEAEPENDFATARGTRKKDDLTEAAQALPTGFGLPPRGPNQSIENKVIPPARFVPGRGLVPDSEQANPEEFPVPFALGGEAPATQPSAKGDDRVNPAGAVSPSSPKRVGTKKHSAMLPPDLPPEFDERNYPDRVDAEGENPDDANPASETEPSGSTAKKARKPLKLDRNLLERALKLRNSGNP